MADIALPPAQRRSYGDGEGFAAPFRWIRKLFAYERPLSIVKRAKKERPANLKGLYLLHVDFPVDQQMRQKIADSLAPISAKYGIDFLPVEPGIRITRFDDL